MITKITNIRSESGQFLYFSDENTWQVISLYMYVNNITHVFKRLEYNFLKYKQLTAIF